jgi:methylenetetrahydrofolate reductase (NADPH)
MQDKNKAASLADRLRGGARLVLAEISPPATGDAAAVKEAARLFCGKVDALAVGDNRDRVRMSALAAAVLVAGEGVEPVLHVNSRDRNRIALVSEALGAQALGIVNILCTSGVHQTLGDFRPSKNVYDMDAVQMLQAFAALDGGGPSLCLGGTASPDADPLELQVLQLTKKVAAGAKFLVTQPVYDLERFRAWWTEVSRRGLHEKAAIVAAVHPLTGDKLAAIKAGKRPQPRMPEGLVSRVASQSDPAAQRRAALEVALDTVGRLLELKGLRGLSVSADGAHDVALEIIDKLPMERG